MLFSAASLRARSRISVRTERATAVPSMILAVMSLPDRLLPVSGQVPGSRQLNDTCASQSLALFFEGNGHGLAHAWPTVVSAARLCTLRCVSRVTARRRLAGYLTCIGGWRLR